MEKFELQILRDLPIEEVANRLGLEVHHHKALCPFHDDHHASLTFNVRKNTYRCFVCGEHGGTIDLVMRRLRKDFREACEWLSGGSMTSEKLKVKDEKFETRPFDPSRYERFFRRPFLSPKAKEFLFVERQIDPRVVRWCRLSSWTDRQGVEWLQIPYFDQLNRLVGLQNRNLSPLASPRFRFPSGVQCAIYNLPVLNRLRPDDNLFITEGASDCWAMLSAGNKAIAIPSATLLSPSHVRLLSDLVSRTSIRFHMFPDRDTPGEQLFLRLRQIIPSLQHHQLPPHCKDYSEFYLATVRKEPHHE